MLQILKQRRNGEKFLRIKPKTDFVGHSKTLFVYVLFCPMIYAPTFWQIKDLMKIHKHGTFHQYSDCGCQAKKFQSFAYQVSIHEMSLFGIFFGSLLSQTCLILLILSPEILYKQAKTLVKLSIKNTNFCGNGRTKVWIFGPTLTPSFLSKDGKKR